MKQWGGSCSLECTLSSSNVVQNPRKDSLPRAEVRYIAKMRSNEKSEQATPTSLYNLQRWSIGTLVINYPRPEDQGNIFYKKKENNSLLCGLFFDIYFWTLLRITLIERRSGCRQIPNISAVVVQVQEPPRLLFSVSMTIYSLETFSQFLTRDIHKSSLPLSME